MIINRAYQQLGYNAQYSVAVTQPGSIHAGAFSPSFGFAQLAESLLANQPP